MFSVSWTVGTSEKMAPFLLPPSLRPPLSLYSFIQISPLPATLTHSQLKPSPNPASLSPISASSTSYPDSSSLYRRNPEQDEAVEEDHVIGDCLVFEDGAFEGDDPFPSPGPGPGGRKERPWRRKPSDAAGSAVASESLVPEKWKEAVAEINLTKKEKRQMAYQLQFGSRMERRRKPLLPDMKEYRAYRELKLSQLKPVVLDNPRGYSPEKEAMAPHETEDPPRGRRVAPRNPRLGLVGGSMEDITDFFNNGDYMPGDTTDDKKKHGSRKLFTKEEKVLLNKHIPSLAEATSSKWLPLQTLAASGNFYLLDVLLKHNVDINAIDKDGFSAIHRAIICKKQAIINYLLRNSANPFVRDKDGATLIHYAVQTGSSETIKILLLYNVDINLPDDDGWTPLHLAVQTQRTDIARLLLIKGADRNLKNQDGLTPLDLCLYSGRDVRTYELIKLLKRLPESNSHP